MNKKIFIILIVALSLFMVTSCYKKKAFISDKQLAKYGLEFLEAPENSSNYYTKKIGYSVSCYMNVSKDDDVINYVTNILNTFETSDAYDVYGYAKGDDMYSQIRKIYQSKNIDDFRLGRENYSEDSVTYNAYYIYYSLSAEKNKKSRSLYILSVVSNFGNGSKYNSKYNLSLTLESRLYSSFVIIEEQ